VHRWSILMNAQRDATQSSLFNILQVHSTCFGCQTHQSSGVHKPVTRASVTGHIFCRATSLQRGQEEEGGRRKRRQERGRERGKEERERGRRRKKERKSLLLLLLSLFSLSLSCLLHLHLLLLLLLLLLLPFLLLGHVGGRQLHKKYDRYRRL